MNQTQEFTNPTAAVETYHRGIWAITIFGGITAFFGCTWLSIQRAEVYAARRETRDAEARIVEVQHERDDAIHERIERARSLNAMLVKSEAARAAAERGSLLPQQPGGKPAETLNIETAAHQAKAPSIEASGPKVEELTAFIKAHLTRTTGPVEGQLQDYAATGVDFHGKSHVSLSVIESERRQTAQKFPVRVIFTNEIQPRFSAMRDSVYPWLCTAIFDFRWEYRSRTGAVLRGVTRGIWKIAPTENGLRILSEASVDPVTGASKD